jgi:hypothetical protein
MNRVNKGKESAKEFRMLQGEVQRKCLRHGSFASKQDLRSTLLDFLAQWNKDLAHPFRWTLTGYPLRFGVAT